MTSTQRLDTENFLARFFGPGNRVSLDEIRTSNLDRWGWVRDWLSYLEGNSPQATVLPRWQDQVQLDWYGLAFSPHQLRELAEELNAFIGPSYSTFRGQRAKLDPADPVEAAVLDMTEGLAFKFHGARSNVGNQRIREALGLMLRARRQRQRRPPEVPRSIGRVLRDFYLALAVGNRDSAIVELQFLQRTSELDASNLLFLKIQFLANFEEWADLLSLAELPDLIQSRRPQAVTQALLQAVYNTELASYEANGNPVGAVAHFRTSVLPRYASLLSHYAGMNAPEVFKCFMLRAVAGEPPLPTLRDTLIQEIELAAPDRVYLEQLAELLEPSPPARTGNLLELARASEQECNFEEAFQLASSASNSWERTLIIFRCAYELQTLEAEMAAVEAFDSLTPAEQDRFLQVRFNRDYYRHLTQSWETQTAPPTDWNAWLRRLHQEPEWAEAVVVARRGAIEWRLETWRTQPQMVSELAELLAASRPAEGELRLNEALPHLAAFFLQDEHWPCRDFKPLYQVLFDLAVLYCQGSRDELTLLSELATTNLALGLTSREYTDLVEAVAEVWQQWRAPTNLDWGLDFLDLLLTYPCPSGAARVHFLSRLLEGFTQFFHRVERNQRILLHQFCSELGQEEAFRQTVGTPDVEEEGSDSEGGGLSQLLGPLGGATLALYTLDESIGQRVRNWLSARCPRDTHIELCHEKVGSRQLREFAQRAEYFIVVTASAKHAATQFIVTHRPPTLPTIYPAGKGAASIIRALLDYLGDLSVHRNAA